MDLITESLDLNVVLDNAAGNPLIWVQFLSELTLQLNCDSSVLLVTDLVERENTHFIYSAHITQDYQVQYENQLNKVDTFNYFISKNPQKAFSNVALINNNPQVDNDFIPFNDQSFRFGISIPCTHNYSLNLLVNRKKAFNVEEQKQVIDVLQSLIPSLEGAMHAEQQHKISSQLIHYIDDYFDGYIIIDRELNILFSDPSYISMISQMDCVRITGSQFSMKNPIIEQQLLTLIEKNETVNTSIHNQCHSCQLTLIPISSLQNLYQWECYKDGFILTFTHNKEKNPSIDRLIDIYRLSKCEAICALHFMKTPSISDIANNTYRSQETVRNHIKHTMQKMDVHNQAELMKKLLTLATL